MFGVIILLENESVAEQTKARWDYVTLKQAMVVLLIHFPIDVYQISDSTEAETTPDHYRATTMLD